MNKLYLVLAIVAFVTVLIISEIRTDKLMELCADHETQTLYKCEDRLNN